MDKQVTATPPLESVLCKRVGALRTVDEHRDCPYCFGRSPDVQSGDRQRFCDFEPGKDPVAFGFPEGSSRDET